MLLHIIILFWYNLAGQERLGGERSGFYLYTIGFDILEKKIAQKMRDPPLPSTAGGFLRLIFDTIG
jgi:hypothetical protein